MFISEQYGWCSEISGEFFDNMLDLGYVIYLYGFDASPKAIRDLDMMLIGL